MPIVGRNEEDARKKLSELMRLADPAVALKMLSSRFGHDMSKFDLDGPVPDLPLSNEIQTHAKVAYEKARKANLTLRDFYNQMAVARGYLFACGNAAMVADVMEEWFTDRACDGFVLVPPYFPAAFDEFIDQVVPELQRRGIFRRDYSGLLCANISACRCHRTDIQSPCRSSGSAAALFQPVARARRRGGVDIE